jgi:hypothetical protein
MAPMPTPILASTYILTVVSGRKNSGKPFRNSPMNTAGRMRGPSTMTAATAMPAGG